MLSFVNFLAESTLNVEKLKHLEHAEDHVINAGKAGFEHAVNTLVGVHSSLTGKKSGTKVTVKYDGAPSIVFGHHPENGKFFVASKSAFNKNPKLNYTPEDVERNHGHAPGLVKKLKEALKHLPKVTPKGKVYQGDMMYGEGDVQETDGKYKFKPNTITYSTAKGSSEGKKIAKAKVGVVVHTEYKGKKLEDMKASFGPSLRSFGSHDDVHIVDPAKGATSAQHDPESIAKFTKNIQAANKLHKGHDYEHIKGINSDDMSTYINSSSTSGHGMTAEGLKAHITTRYNKKIDDVKSDKAKTAKREELASHLAHIDQNKDKFDRTFKIHKHVQEAKHALVSSLANAKLPFEHEIDGKPTGPEGHVAIIDNKPTKLVDRSPSGFAAANRAGGGIKSILNK